MPWQCKLIEFHKGMHVRSDGDLKIGDMFFMPLAEEDRTRSLEFLSRNLSDFYYANNAGRRPLFIVLPGPTIFCIDSKCWSSGNYYGGWEVRGEAPNITMTPSINIGSTYHGFLQNGMITDDCEGRVFDEEGYEVKK